MKNRADHDERVSRSSLALWNREICLPWEVLEADLPNVGQIRLRVEYDPTGVIRVDARPYFPTAMSLVKLFETYTEYPHKFADRTELESIYKHRGMAHDVLMVINGLVADTTTANVAIYDGTDWMTPRKPLLQGTCRARMIRQGLLKEADISEAMLRNAQSVVIMNALRGVVRVGVV